MIEYIYGKYTTIMFEGVYQWILSIVAWILSWFGISMENRTVGGANATEESETVVETPSIYSMNTMEPQPMESA